ncbi:hypothetical protein, partial [Vibrio cidicii]
SRTVLREAAGEVPVAYSPQQLEFLCEKEGENRGRKLSPCIRLCLQISIVFPINKFAIVSALFLSLDVLNRNVIFVQESIAFELLAITRIMVTLVTFVECFEKKFILENSHCSY